MKILAIRGENLASLARPFDIELAEGPLAQSGLFAITGPTGSGKSTLLDALCLALYDQTPRYTTGRQGAEVGARDGDNKLWIKSNDVRQILSRGKAEGWAEVDFVGTDGDRYRARWTVRRARGKLDGRLQSQEMSLTHLATGKVESGKKTEVLESIETKIGLSWDQFRRAVLLAQGDFAAFLKATPKARSELLERLTGTEIYSRIGSAAFERGRRAEQELDKLLEARDSLELMDEEALAALAAELTALTETLQRGQGLLAEAGRVTTLAEQCQGQEVRIQAAADKVAELEARQGEFDALAEQLQVFDRVQSARPLYQELSQLDVAMAESEPKLVRQRDASQANQARMAELEGQLPVLQAAFTEAEQGWQRWQGQRGEAEQLLRQQQGVSQELTQLQSRLDPLKAALKQSEAQAAEQQHRLAALQQERQQLQQLREGHPELVALAGQWPQWQKRLLALGQDSEQWHRLRQQLRQLQPALVQEQAELNQLTQLRDRLNREEGTLAQALSEWRAQEPENREAESLAEQEQTLRHLVHLLELEKRLQPEERRRMALEQALTELTEQQSQWQPQRQKLERQIEANTIAFTEVQHQIQQAQATLALEQYRPILEDGEPCPLCGGTDHPYASQRPAVDAVLSGMAGRLEALKLEIERDRATLHRGLALAEQAGRNAQQWQREHQELSQALTQLREAQQGVLEAHPQWQGLSPSQLHHTYQQLEQALTQAHRQQQQWRQWQQQDNQFQKQLEELRQGLASAQQQHHQWELSVKQGQERQSQLEAELARLQTALKSEQGELASVLPQLPWSELAQYPAQLPPLVVQLDRELEQLSRAQARLTELEQALEHWQTESQTLALALQEQRTSIGVLEPKRAELDELAEQLEGALQRCLEGEALEARHQRLSDAWKRAQTSLTEAEQALNGARTEQAALASALTQLEESRAAQQAQRRECVARWSALLQELGLAEQQVLALMGRDHTWRHAEQQRVSEYHLACEGARRDHQGAIAALAERQASHQTAQAQWLQKLAESEFDATDLAQLKQVLAVLERQQFERRHRQAQQASLKERAAQLSAQALEAEQACRVWLELKEVIGSADGSRFRAMAQSLTLSQLLQLANTQLAELAPRYRLQQTPGNGLDLQVVDGDMGEEIRAIESLSGGETFLVSLALALALSALTTGGGRIGSLFIDEGFGTLDPDSLEMALSCLDALQAAGRQVGVISHVQTLVERIGTRVQLSAAGGGTSQLRVVER
ncbi:AAA family ATPase [Ferrimonas balearica]|uniref:AAA family ATPase n=1 Tax=Ferrimonas balearica TaxID=44012 RepID=UPI001C9921A3|nr:AAA family ATPase [Ferrimonas balearica]MBY5921944.1 AAA family ATPase [Ferrimonas balearica]MBY5994716.1 AAA family ATPase [Ferrimonas balearica]